MIYFDNAATTFPKPLSVSSEVTRCIRSYCGNPGRGSHALSRAAAEKIYECRELASAFFGLDAPENVVMTVNTTATLNMAIKGLLRRGDHVLISDMEHNAVLRPIASLARRGEITYDVFSTFSDSGRIPSAQEICRAISACIRPETRAVICTHASNICSVTLPIAEIGALCHARGLYLIVDGAQSAGILPIDMKNMHIDALCVPGHKALYGIQGSGMLLLAPGLQLETLIEGGNGVNSLDDSMPDIAPERYESGTLPTPAIAGLCEGMRFVRGVGLQRIGEHERALGHRMTELLTNTRGVKVYAPQFVGSTVLFSVDGMPSDAVGRALDTRGFCVRCGFHCTALGHRTLGTPESGAVRVSFGYFNRAEQTERFYRALREIQRDASAPDK